MSALAFDGEVRSEDVCLDVELGRDGPKSELKEAMRGLGITVDLEPGIKRRKELVDRYFASRTRLQGVMRALEGLKLVLVGCSDNGVYIGA